MSVYVILFTILQDIIIRIRWNKEDNKTPFPRSLGSSDGSPVGFGLEDVVYVPLFRGIIIICRSST